ncbi:T9SS type A sorting domain-containing protein [Crocinitomix algicola]|uniref:T9SS type A sorting domain-containing protein n=1 Tax=Crocinitomix algicola TaxID=1740263 RepID=UPI001112FFF5|nr:T9SS type A sorting domain-containing protein [Crocinitomix algicola]
MIDTLLTDTLKHGFMFWQENAWYAVGVGDPSTCTEVLSIEPDETANACSIYPNPSFDNQITINWENYENYQISLFDLKGRLISKYSSTNNLVKIELPNISNGVYILTLTAEEITINKKIIIQ